MPTPTIVTLSRGELVTSSQAIADGTEYPHKSVIQLVRTHRADLEEFGLLAFEMRPRPKGQHGGGDVEIALLNEPQATYLLTLMRNNEIVKAFKKALVKAFFALRRRERQRAAAGSAVKIDKDEYIDLLKAKIAFLEQQATPRRRPLTEEERQQIRELAAVGLGPAEIGGEVGRSPDTVRTFLRQERLSQEGQS
jgi:phage regulator Rha-like protein